uniref:Uncharacterized protein n=1 Tax=Arundo donax TaxID=35708 RepID=A0A0A9AP78_ARUDO
MVSIYLNSLTNLIVKVGKCVMNYPIVVNLCRNFVDILYFN